MQRRVMGLLVAAALGLTSGCEDAGYATPCPSWVDFPRDMSSNRPSQYLGCSNRENLRNMLADPADLERGRALGPADGVRETGAIERYRRGPAPPSDGSSKLPTLQAAPSIGDKE